jgi:hypothetical protein
MGKTKNTLEQKSYAKVTNPRGHERIRASFPIPNLKKYTTKYLDLEPLSRTLGKKQNLG